MNMSYKLPCKYRLWKLQEVKDTKSLPSASRVNEAFNSYVRLSNYTLIDSMINCIAYYPSSDFGPLISIPQLHYSRKQLCSAPLGAWM